MTKPEVREVSTTISAQPKTFQQILYSDMLDIVRDLLEFYWNLTKIYNMYNIVILGAKP